MKFRTSQSISELWDNFKQPNKLEIRVPKGGEERVGAQKKIFQKELKIYIKSDEICKPMDPIRSNSKHKRYEKKFQKATSNQTA